MTTITTQRLVNRIGELIASGEEILKTRVRQDEYNEYVDAARMKGFRAAGLSFIERVFGNQHSHFTEFKNNTPAVTSKDAEYGIGILRAIKDEIAGDWLFSIKGLVAAEVFADFLEMADHLLDSGYKDPAAITAGSVLEEHMRQLCRRAGIDTDEDRDGKSVPKKADRLNADLAKAEIYSKLDQKQITAWLDLRNLSAHGRYTEYGVDQVRQMLSGVTEFMARVAS